MNVYDLILESVERPVAVLSRVEISALAECASAQIVEPRQIR